MTFRPVYSVLNDAPAAGREYGLIFLVGAVGWLLVWLTFARVLRTQPAERQPNWRAGFVVGAALVAIGALVVATDTYPAFAAQARCRARLRQGDHQTTEGSVSHSVREPGRNARARFRVGEVPFEYRTGTPKGGGFAGTFTEPGTEGLALRNGSIVRVAHADGIILALEVAE